TFEGVGSAGQEGGHPPHAHATTPAGSVKCESLGHACDNDPPSLPYSASDSDVDHLVRFTQRPGPPGEGVRARGRAPRSPYGRSGPFAARSRLSGFRPVQHEVVDACSTCPDMPDAPPGRGVRAMSQAATVSATLAGVSAISRTSRTSLTVWMVSSSRTFWGTSSRSGSLRAGIR